MSKELQWAGIKIGDRMEDGTVYAGISPDTGKPIFALPANAPLTMKWAQAVNYAAEFEAYGRSKGAFRIPSMNELRVLFENHAKIGGFKETGIPGSELWYWSSEGGRGFMPWPAYSMPPGGWRGGDIKSLESSLRLVRD